MRLTSGRPSSGRRWLVFKIFVVAAAAGSIAVGASQLMDRTDAETQTKAEPVPVSAPVSEAVKPQERTKSQEATPALAATALPTPDRVWPVDDFLATETGLLRVDGATNVAELDPGFTPSAGRTAFYKTGGMAASFGFDEDMVAVTASPSELGLVAFTDPFPEGRDIYNPGPRQISNIVVVDTSETSPRTFTFKGNIVPEVFAADGKSLFVIDHLIDPDDATGEPLGYRVLLLDLDTGELEEVFGPLKTPPGEVMEGVGRRQLGIPSEDMLFTLYTRQPADHGASLAAELGINEGAAAGHDHTGHDHGGYDHAVHEEGQVAATEVGFGGSGHAEGGATATGEGMHGFVHTLSLTDEWAICIDLPKGFGYGPPESAALALDIDAGATNGQLLALDSYAGGEAGQGQIAVFDTAEMTTMQVLTNGIPKPTGVFRFTSSGEGVLHAQVVGESLVVAQGNVVQYLSLANNFEVTHRYEVDGVVEHLTANADTLDGQHQGQAFAVVAGRLVPLPTGDDHR